MIPRQGQRKIRRVRDALIAADPHCHWCGCVTLPAVASPFHPDMATVDHVKPRRECRSQEEYESETNHVLSCLECNQQRDQVDIALMKHQKEQQEKLAKLRKAKRRVLVRTPYLA